MKKTIKTMVITALISSLLACSACGSDMRKDDTSEIKVEVVPVSSVGYSTLAEGEKEWVATIPVTPSVSSETTTASPEEVLHIDSIFVENPIGDDGDIELPSNEKDASYVTTSEKKEEITESTTEKTEISPEDKTPKEKELIASFSTNFSMEEELLNRCYNLNLACEECSVIIPAGEDFNWHVIVGNTNYAEGYKLANMYSAGKLVQGYGGGVCQVSTTIYGCVRLLGLPTKELHHHGLPVDYVDWDNKEDAAVDDIGGYNFIFTNITGDDIEIKCYTTEIEENELKERGLLTVEFYKLIY